MIVKNAKKLNLSWKDTTKNSLGMYIELKQEKNQDKKNFKLFYNVTMLKVSQVFSWFMIETSKKLREKHSFLKRHWINFFLIFSENWKRIRWKKQKIVMSSNFFRSYLFFFWNKFTHFLSKNVSKFEQKPIENWSKFHSNWIDFELKSIEKINVFCLKSVYFFYVSVLVRIIWGLFRDYLKVICNKWGEGCRRLVWKAFSDFQVFDHFLSTWKNRHLWEKMVKNLSGKSPNNIPSADSQQIKNTLLKIVVA